MFFEETTSTLLWGNLFAQGGELPATSTDSPMEATIEAEKQFGYGSGAPHASSVLDGLASLQPSTLALMHRSAHSGGADRWLSELAD